MSKKSIKVYVAGPWVRKDEAAAARERLKAEGFTVTSRWIDVPQDVDQNDVEYMTAQGIHDFEDVQRADCVLVLNLEKSEGKAVEQGLALAWDMPLIIVGERSNIFQYLPQVRMMKTLDQAIGYLNQVENVLQEVSVG